MARSTRSWAMSAATPRTLAITPATIVDKCLRIGGLSSRKVNIVSRNSDLMRRSRTQIRAEQSTEQDDIRLGFCDGCKEGLAIRRPRDATRNDSAPIAEIGERL